MNRPFKVLESIFQVGNFRFTRVPFRALSDHVWIRYHLTRLGISTTGKDMGIIRIKHFQENRQYLPHYSSLHRESLEITLTVPLMENLIQGKLFNPIFRRWPNLFHGFLCKLEKKVFGKLYWPRNDRFLFNSPFIISINFCFCLRRTVLSSYTPSTKY